MRKFIKEAYEHLGEGTKKKPVTINGKLIEPQRNKWSCGPWALRFCFMKWGMDVDPYELMELARTTRSGTDEAKLASAVRRMGSTYEEFYRLTPKEARLTINRLLRRGKSLILCTEKCSHWIACLYKSKRGYLVFDSRDNGPVIKLPLWEDIEERMRFTDESDGITKYFIISVSRPCK